MYPSNININSTSFGTVLEEGDILYLHCMHDGGPNNTYSWFINEQMLNTTEQTLIHTISLADEDGGFYNCQVNNPAGQSSGGVYILTVPVVYLPPVDTSSLVGGVAMFTCGARGFPKPSYTWTKTDGSLPNASIISTSNDGVSTLTILLVELEDHGEYNCIVSGAEEVNHSAILTGKKTELIC